MAKQDEIEARIKELLALTERPEGVYKDEVLEALSVSKRTAENMRNTLIQRGYCIENKGKGKGVWWRNKDAEDGEIAVDEIAIELDARAAVYLFYLQTTDEEYTRDEFFQMLQMLEGDTKEKMMYASQSNAFTKTINRLIDNKLIRLKKKKDGREILQLTHNASRCMPVMTEMGETDIDDAANEILDLLKDYDSGNNQELSSIIGKMEMVISGELFGNDGKYDLHSRKSDKSKVVGILKEKLLKYDYRNYALKIEFESRKNKTDTRRVKVGLIYYSRWQDEVYLLGEDIENSGIVSIVISRIINVKQINVVNNLYDSEDFRRSFAQMFDVSYSEPVNVVVRFANNNSNIEKIEQLHKIREYSSFTKEGESYIYRDTIIGTGEFLTYLRQFGNGCEILEPEDLREGMKQSPERILNRYREEGLYHE